MNKDLFAKARKQFNKDIEKAVKKVLLAKWPLDEKTVDFVLSSYDFHSYLMEGVFSHLEEQIKKVDEARHI